jgi:hypothetical protein
MNPFYLLIAFLATVVTALSSESSRVKIKGRIAEEMIVLCNPGDECPSGEITIEVLEPASLCGNQITHIARWGNQRFVDKNGAEIGSGDIIEFTVSRKYIDPKRTGSRSFKKLKDVCLIEKHIPPPETDEQKAKREARKKIPSDGKGPWAPPPGFVKPTTSQESPAEGKAGAESNVVGSAEKK